MIFRLKTSVEKLALLNIKKQLKYTIIENAKKDEQQKKLPDKNFVIDKIIGLKTSIFTTQRLFFDDGKKLFIFQNGNDYSKTYKYSDVLKYEVYENGESKIKGTVGKSIVGGMLFGLGGAVVGSSASKKVHNKCDQLKLIITINDFQCPQIIITYINDWPLDKNGSLYKQKIFNIQQVCSQLEFMINRKTREQQELLNNYPKTLIDRKGLEELKSMLDDGLINQEEYDYKKKQILDIKK